MMHRHPHCHPGEACFVARHHRRGRRGLSGFAPGFAGGRGGFPFGRFVGDGELRLIVLSLLAETPRHGYDIIKELESRTDGFYSPSPGVIYPTLTYLEEAGHADAAAEGTKKIYAITEAGRAFLKENQVEADAILARIRYIASRLKQARSYFEREAEGGRPDIPETVLEAARRALDAAIAAKADAPAEEQKRIADLILKVAREIAGS